jgi:hypothetical protein
MAISTQGPTQLGDHARNDKAYRDSLGAPFDSSISKYRNLFRVLRHRDTGREIRAVLERERGLYLSRDEEVSLGEAYAVAYAVELEHGPSHLIPTVALDDVLRQYWRIVGTPSDHTLQSRRSRQAQYLQTRRATEAKPDERLTAREVMALVLLDDSPLSHRERRALINVRLGTPADEAEKRARTRMRATLKRSRYDQLDRIEQMVSALYQAHLIAPLEDELDSITAEESFAELADMRAVFVPEDME